mmetsp:Transcript_9141/g.35757  ORF Transcript_9141/g.35757 Transcript_9141/m.35757 type:complete len:221 (+) Transcript_9141:1182-1844(+)
MAACAAADMAPAAVAFSPAVCAAALRSASRSAPASAGSPRSCLRASLIERMSDTASPSRWKSSLALSTITGTSSSGQRTAAAASTSELPAAPGALGALARPSGAVFPPRLPPADEAASSAAASRGDKAAPPPPSRRNRSARLPTARRTLLGLARAHPTPSPRSPKIALAIWSPPTGSLARRGTSYTPAISTTPRSTRRASSADMPWRSSALQSLSRDDTR